MNNHNNDLYEHRVKVAGTVFSHALAFCVFVLGTLVWFTYRDAMTLVITSASSAWLSYTFFEIITFVAYGGVLMVVTLISQHFIERQLHSGERIPRMFVQCVVGEGLIWVLCKVIIQVLSRLA